MKTLLKFPLVLLFVSLGITGYCQDGDSTKDDEIKTIWNGHGLHSRGYGALSNKFTRIGGQFANLAEVYGGWYINHRFLLGVSAAAVTNDIRVPDQYSIMPGEKMSYEYGQVGLVTEYTMNSNQAVHLSFQLFSGAGFTTQYIRDFREGDHDKYTFEDGHDTNWFFVTEPGIKVEMNIFKWMRFSPGVSYRAAFGSNAKGLSDKDLNGASVNLTLKVGRF